MFSTILFHLERYFFTGLQILSSLHVCMIHGQHILFQFMDCNIPFMSAQTTWVVQILSSKQKNADMKLLYAQIEVYIFFFS